MARASWSGQDVPLNPHLIPFTLAITSSAFIPSTREPIPLRFPLQPPKNETFEIVPSFKSNLIFEEQTPFVLYSYVKIIHILSFGVYIISKNISQSKVKCSFLYILTKKV